MIREAGLIRCAAFVQHGDTSCLLHCVAVAYYSAAILDLLRIRYDRRALVRGALLHDFFLYDWHNHSRAPGERCMPFRIPWPRSRMPGGTCGSLPRRKISFSGTCFP